MSRDPRIRRALELLREVVAEGAGRSPEAAGWPDASESEPWLPSATDLLVSWHPAGGAAGAPVLFPDAEAWERYFAAETSSGAAEDERAIGASGASEPAGDASAQRSSEAIEIPADWLGREPGAAVEPPLPPGAEEEVVDALYAFLHALERRDVEAALALVAEDYHAMDGDREVDRAELRRRIESFLDPRRAGRLAISPTRIPEPIAHPCGVLVHLTLAVDHVPPDDRPPESLALERLALFEQGRDGRWRLAALAPVQAQP